MKITLVIVMLWTTHLEVTTSTTTSNSTQMLTAPQWTTSGRRKIVIPMPDLPVCREARKQFIDIPDVFAVACDEE
jgi:hypothetical protein